MMGLGIISVLLILLNCLVSYRGFKDSFFYSKYEFEVEKVLLYKDYKRLITSGFLHTGWMHLVFNMLALFFFGAQLEHSINPVLFLFIYLASLVGGNYFSLIIHKHDSAYTAVGASGAVTGIIFASIALFPGMPISLFFLPAIPAWIYGLLYVLYAIYGIQSRKNNVGHDAHLAGGLTGMLLAIAFFPSVITTNYFAIGIITIPAIVFMVLIIKYPHLLIAGSLFKKKSHNQTIDDRYNMSKKSREEEIDRILEKIHKKGMKSLTSEEKSMLEEFSNSQ
ncbi:MAG: rhomboid family intramembrane serine protease [Chitinophagaceae bacterium]